MSLLSANQIIEANQATVVVIDPGVESYQMLVDGVVDGAKVFVLDAHRDGVQQITELLQTLKSEVQNGIALHIVSHGAPGTLYLGNGELSLINLDRYVEELKSWFKSKSNIQHPTSELFLYGCNVAAGDAGEELITKLNALTGAEVAASTTPIGNVNLGGNWHLDASSRDTILPFNAEAIESYAGILMADTDGDGVDDNVDLDDDNDGILDTVESTEAVAVGNGDFEGGTPGFGASSPPWTNGAGSADLFAPTGTSFDHVNLASPNGGQYQGATNFGVQEEFFQDFSGLTIGTTYTVSFYQMADLLIGSGTEDRFWNITFGGAGTQSSSIITQSGWRVWQQEFLTFTATATTERLTFQAGGTSEGDVWIFVDGVSLTAS